MNSIVNSKELDSEIKYWEVEYENKLAKNKIGSISKTITEITSFLNQNNFFFEDH